MKRWLKIAIATVAISALSCTFVGCTEGNGQSWLNQLTCEHEWDDGVVTKEATCTAEGTLTKTCEKCEKVKTEKTPKAEHDEELLMKTDATCDVDGEALYECKDCGAFRKEVLKAEGHSALKCSGVAATCGEEGYTDYVVCENCDKVLTPSDIIPAIGTHNYGEDGICTVCQSPKAAEVLAMYADADNVTEAEVDTNELEFEVYTVFRVYRPTDDTTMKNSLYIDEISDSAGGLEFGAYNVGIEPNASYKDFYKNFPFYIGAVSAPHEVYMQEGNYKITVEGDFSYAVHEDYIDFCFGKSIYVQGSFPLASTSQSFGCDTAWSIDSITLNNSVNGIKILSLNA